MLLLALVWDSYWLPQVVVCSYYPLILQTAISLNRTQACHRAAMISLVFNQSPFPSSSLLASEEGPLTRTLFFRTSVARVVVCFLRLVENHLILRDSDAVGNTNIVHGSCWMHQTIGKKSHLLVKWSPEFVMRWNSKYKYMLSCGGSFHAHYIKS